jgi:fibrillarin-like rRNA methylase
MYSAKHKIVFKLASTLFKTSFPLYNFLYFKYKKRKDAYQLFLLKNLICKGDKVLDIGANIGFYVSEMQKLCGNEGFIHAFEPDKTNFNLLLKNTQNLDNVKKNRI